MLEEFIINNRDIIMANSQARVDLRTTVKPITPFVNGKSQFLDQLRIALETSRSSEIIDHFHIDESAGLHGHDLLNMGMTIGQVVHEYGDICQSITELAILYNVQITGEEFKTLNLCLDDAIAGAVTGYNLHREIAIRRMETERLGIFAHEMRNMLSTAILAYDSLKGGRVAIGGSTGSLLGRSLTRLCSLIERTLTDVRLDSGIKNLERIVVPEFLCEIEISAMLQASSFGITLKVYPVDKAIAIEGDRQILMAAISNLLHNAFKFTHKNSTVSLVTRVTVDRVYFDIEDECGGFPPGKIEELFAPFSQHGADRSGLGLGLIICQKAAKSNGGEIYARDLPGKGCIFTMDLPRKVPPPFTLIGGGGNKDQISSKSTSMKTSRFAGIMAKKGWFVA